MWQSALAYTGIHLPSKAVCAYIGWRLIVSVPVIPGLPTKEMPSLCSSEAMLPVNMATSFPARTVACQH